MTDETKDKTGIPDAVSTSFIKGADKFKNTTPLKFPQNYLSISQVTKYSMCPMSYYWRYVAKIKSPSRPNMMLGTATHRVLQTLSEMQMEAFNENDIRGCFEAAFTDMMEDLTTVEKSTENMEELEDKKKRYFPSLVLYCKTEVPKMKIIGEEVQISKEIPIYSHQILPSGNLRNEKIGEMTFVGFMDFLNDTNAADDTPKKKKTEFEDLGIKNNKTLEIGDYKVGAEKDHTYFISDLQTPFYSYATGIPNVRIDNILTSRVKYTKKNEPWKNNIPPSYSVLKYKPKKHDVDSMLQQCSNVAVGIGNGIFPMCHPTFWMCSPDNCEYWNSCRGKSGGEEKYLQEVVAEKYKDTIR